MEHMTHEHAADSHQGHGHGGHGDHGSMFRRRFWWSLLLTVPVVVTSEMVMDWFGYELDFPGIDLVGPVLGSVDLLLGWLAVPRRRRGQSSSSRQPGMMLLISMAITVAYVASLATSLGWFDLEFWWELAALISDHAARALARDEGARPGAVGAAGAGRPAAG